MEWKLLRRGRAKKTAPAPVALDFAPIVPTRPTGPGSLRGWLDPTAHETRTAAARRAVS